MTAKLPDCSIDLEEAIVSKTYRVSFSDCCVHGSFTASVARRNTSPDLDGSEFLDSVTFDNGVTISGTKVELEIAPRAEPLDTVGRDALNAYAQQNADVHRENRRLNDENVALRYLGKLHAAGYQVTMGAVRAGKDTIVYARVERPGFHGPREFHASTLAEALTEAYLRTANISEGE